MQSRLEEYLTEIARPLPFPEREEWRTEVEHHLSAMIAAYEELGYSSEEAADLAIQRFGAPARLGRKMRTESLLTGIARTRWLGQLTAVVRFSLCWTFIWGAIGGGITAGARFWAPATVGPESAWEVALRVGMIGTVSGLVFGLLMLALESGRDEKGPHLFRMAVIGVLASVACKGVMFDQMYLAAACFLGMAGGLGSSAMLSLSRRKTRKTA